MDVYTRLDTHQSGGGGSSDKGWTARVGFSLTLSACLPHAQAGMEHQDVVVRCRQTTVYGKLSQLTSKVWVAMLEEYHKRDGRASCVEGRLQLAVGSDILLRHGTSTLRSFFRIK